MFQSQKIFWCEKACTIRGIRSREPQDCWPAPCTSRPLSSYWRGIWNFQTWTRALLAPSGSSNWRIPSPRGSSRGWAKIAGEKAKRMTQPDGSEEQKRTCTSSLNLPRPFSKRNEHFGTSIPGRNWPISACRRGSSMETCQWKTRIAGIPKVAWRHRAMFYVSIFNMYKYMSMGLINSSCQWILEIKFNRLSSPIHSIFEFNFFQQFNFNVNFRAELIKNFRHFDIVLQLAKQSAFGMLLIVVVSHRHSFFFLWSAYEENT